MTTDLITLSGVDVALISTIVGAGVALFVSYNSRVNSRSDKVSSDTAARFELALDKLSDRIEQTNVRLVGEIKESTDALSSDIREIVRRESELNEKVVILKYSHDSQRDDIKNIGDRQRVLADQFNELRLQVTTCKGDV